MGWQQDVLDEIDAVLAESRQRMKSDDNRGGTMPKIVTLKETGEWLKVDGESKASCHAALDRTEADMRLQQTIAQLRVDMRFHPASDIATSVRKATEAHRQEEREIAEEAVTERGAHLADAPDFAAAAERYRDLPGVIGAHERRTNAGGMSDVVYVGLHTLDAIVGGQVETTLKNRELTAVQLDSQHADLLDGDVDEPRTNITLRCIEARRGDLLSIVKPFDPLREPEQESALRRLRERIATARDARVPDVIKQAIEAVETGKKELEKIRAVRRLQIVSRRTLADAKKWRQQA